MFPRRAKERWIQACVLVRSKKRELGTVTVRNYTESWHMLVH